MRKNGIKLVLFYLAGSLSSYLFCKFKSMRKNVEEKDRKYSRLFDNWLILVERGDDVGQFFRERDIKEIAVYGYGNIGRHLVTQLLQLDVSVKYVIDKRKDGTITNNIPCYQLSDNIPNVDMIVITPICEYQKIECALKEISSAKIISVEDIIYELL